MSDTVSGLRLNHKTVLIISLLLITLLQSSINTPILQADGEGWLNGWDYRRSKIVNNSTGAGTNYPIEVTVYYNSSPSLFDSFTKGGQLEIPHYGGGGALHSDVLYFPDGRGGYKYWMVYTPYPPGSEEEPSIVRSNNGVIWTDTGISNPVVPTGADDEIPDPDWLYVSDYSKWFMVYGRHNATRRTIFLSTSTNGTTWVEDGVLIDGSEAYEVDDTPIPYVTEPTMIFEDDWFYVWYNVLNTEANVNNKRWTCLAKFQWNDTSGSVYNFERDVGNPFLHQAADGTYDIGQGHISVVEYEDTYYMYGLRWATGLGGEYDMCLWNSTDKTTWNYMGAVIERGGAGAWDEEYIYRGGPVTYGNGSAVVFSDKLMLHYSGSPDGVSNPDIGIAYGDNGGLDLNGLSETDFGDIRFTSDDGSTELDYALLEKVDSDYATFGIEVADNLNSSDATIYIYYGNGASTTSSFDDTFLLYDDFDDESLDASKWSVFEYGSGTATEPAGTSAFLDVNPSVSSDNAGIKSVATYTDSFKALIKRKQASENRYYIGMSIGAGAALDDGGNSPPTGLHQVSLRSGYWFRFYDTGHASSVIYRNPASGSPVAISSGPVNWTTCATYAIWEMIYDQNGRLTWKIDGILSTSQPIDTNFQTDEKYVLVNQGSYDGGAYGADTDIDYVLVKKYVDPEPVHDAWGSEETEPSNVDPTVTSFVISDLSDGNTVFKNLWYRPVMVVDDADGLSNIGTSYFSFETDYGWHNVSYNYQTDVYAVPAGGGRIIIANGYTESSGTSLTINFYLMCLEPIDVKNNVDVYCRVTDASGGDSDWSLEQSDYFNILDYVEDIGGSSGWTPSETPSEEPQEIWIDSDGDGIPNWDDPDVDGDWVPNEYDPDIDGDEIPNELDPEPFIPAEVEKPPIIFSFKTPSGAIINIINPLYYLKPYQKIIVPFIFILLAIILISMYAKREEEKEKKGKIAPKISTGGYDKLGELRRRR